MSSQIINFVRNLEFKVRVADLSRVEQIAQQLGAAFGGELHQLDTYFVAPSGRLKLREINHVQGELIFYQRPEGDATRWSDYFVAPVADCAAMRDVLTRALGARVQVAKSRRLYWYRGARIHLDVVSGLGTFIEFEVPVQLAPDLPYAAGEEQPPPNLPYATGEEQDAHDIIRELMQAFGFRDDDSIRASYSELLETL